jgi:hypothetical protein
MGWTPVGHGFSGSHCGTENFTYVVKRFGIRGAYSVGHYGVVSTLRDTWLLLLDELELFLLYNRMFSRHSDGIRAGVPKFDSRQE